MTYRRTTSRTDVRASGNRCALLFTKVVYGTPRGAFRQRSYIVIHIRQNSPDGT